MRHHYPSGVPRRMIIAALLVGVAAGCSSQPATRSPRPLSPAPTTDTAATSGTVSATAPATGTPSRSAAASSKPLSPFEADPAVRAMRQWDEQAARTVNSGRYIDAALRPLMTAHFARGMKQVLGVDVGLRYPGPLPMQPVGVTVTNSTHRIVKICALYAGYARDPATDRPKTSRKVSPAYAYLVERNGAWRMDGLTQAKGFSCAHVTVRSASW